MGLCQFVSNGGSPGFPLGIPRLLFITCRWGKRSVFQRAYVWMSVECGSICKETWGRGAGEHRDRWFYWSAEQGVFLQPLSLASYKPSHTLRLKQPSCFRVPRSQITFKQLGFCYFCFITGCVSYIVLVWFLACVCETEFAEKNKIVLVFWTQLRFMRDTK